MKKYFRRLIDTKLLQREPLCLYHHPTHHHLDLFADVFDYVRSKRIDNYSYAEYASWWRTRDETVWTHHLDRERNELTAHTTDPNAGVYWRIVFPNGEESIVNAEGTVSFCRFRAPVPNTNRFPRQILPGRDGSISGIPY